MWSYYIFGRHGLYNHNCHICSTIFTWLILTNEKIFTCLLLSFNKRVFILSYCLYRILICRNYIHVDLFVIMYMNCVIVYGRTSCKTDFGRWVTLVKYVLMKYWIKCVISLIILLLIRFLIVGFDREEQLLWIVRHVCIGAPIRHSVLSTLRSNIFEQLLNGRSLSMHDTTMCKSFHNARWLLFSERQLKLWCNLNNEWDWINILRNLNFTACDQMDSNISRYTLDVTTIFRIRFSYNIFLQIMALSHRVAIPLKIPSNDPVMCQDFAGALPYNFLVAMVIKMRTLCLLWKQWNEIRGVRLCVPTMLFGSKDAN